MVVITLQVVRFHANTWESISNTTRLSDSQTSFFDSTSRTFFITGLQLEVGQNPTTFEHEPFERTLAKCQIGITKDGKPILILMPFALGQMNTDTFWVRSV